MFITVFKLTFRLCTDQAIRSRPGTSDTQVLFQVRQCRICGGLYGTGTCFSPCTLGFLHSYLSIVPYSFILYRRNITLAIGRFVQLLSTSVSLTVALHDAVRHIERCSSCEGVLSEGLPDEAVV